MAEDQDAATRSRLKLALLQKDPPTSLEALRAIVETCPQVAKKALSAPMGSPLQIACRNPQTTEEVVRYLIDLWPESVQLDARVPIDDPHYGYPNRDFVDWEDDEELPIHAACYAGCSIAVLKTLLHYYPEGVKAKTEPNELTPLHLVAMSSPERSLDTVKFLVEQSPDAVKALDRDNDLPLHSVRHLGLLNAAPEISELIKFLVDAYPEGLQVRGEHSQLPIHIAVERGASLETIKHMVSLYPKSLEEKDGTTYLPIEKACQATQYVSVELLDYLLQSSPGSPARGVQLLRHYLDNEDPSGYSKRGLEIIKCILKSSRGEKDKAPCQTTWYPLHQVCRKALGDTPERLHDAVLCVLDTCPSALFVENDVCMLPLDYFKSKGGSQEGQEVLRKLMTDNLWDILQGKMDANGIPRDLFCHILTFVF